MMAFRHCHSIIVLFSDRWIQQANSVEPNQSTLRHVLTRKAPNTTIAEIVNTVDPDETAHNELLIWIYSVCRLVFDFSTLFSLY